MLSLLATARRAADRPALLIADRCITYAEMAARVARAMARLPERDPASGGIAFTPHLDEASLVLLWAILERGHPVVLLHPRATEPERAARIELSRPSMVLGADGVAELVRGQGHAARPAEIASSDRAACYRSAEEIAAVLFSSGSTGAPKGIRLSHRAFQASARASELNLGWREDDRWLLCMPLAHAGGLSIVTRCALAGRAVVVHERFDVARFLDAPRRQGATLASVVPTMLRALLEQDDDGRLRGFRNILVGGAPTPDDLLRECQARSIPVLCTYGLTEACSQVATWSMSGEGAVHPALRPLSGVELLVTDAAGEVAPPGMAGTLWFRGEIATSGTCGGRAHRPDEWLDTGDVGMLDDEGCLTVFARRQDLILTGGENVYPAEVEQVLCACRGVAGAVVFGVDDPRWGQAVAVAIQPAGSSFDMREVDRALRRDLASYKRPRLCCVVSSLAVQSRDKPNRREIATELRGALRAWPISAGAEARQASSDPDSA